MAQADSFTQHLLHPLSPPPRVLAASSFADFLPLLGVPCPCSEGTCHFALISQLGP